MNCTHRSSPIMAATFRRIHPGPRTEAPAAGRLAALDEAGVAVPLAVRLPGWAPFVAANRAGPEVHGFGGAPVPGEGVPFLAPRVVVDDPALDIDLGQHPRRVVADDVPGVSGFARRGDDLLSSGTCPAVGKTTPSVSRWYFQGPVVARAACSSSASWA